MGPSLGSSTREVRESLGFIPEKFTIPACHRGLWTVFFDTQIHELVNEVCEMVSYPLCFTTYGCNSLMRSDRFNAVVAVTECIGVLEK